MKNKLTLLFAGLVALSQLQGCAVALVGATAVGVSAAQDPRSIGSQIDDQGLEMAIGKVYNQTPALAQENISVIAYNRNILLVGQVSEASLSRQAEEIARDTDNVDKVFNQLRVGNQVSATTSAHDAWLTSKVKVSLFNDDDFDSSNVKVVTENSEVFLLGKVTEDEADKAVAMARNIDGVRRVITAFTIVDHH
ncbi:osmotically-inducible protein OsmY [Idiomarina tyrosinivorans]|uniref:Osmotically-inducible protein OsmY n=1 Tax=Idiomarina tyrosinivorans TaxID=1445662 RepID=A0A432ZQ73_9GAMM|nr:division/outer membrane stress-associated lipid-binding lipoprotein [Idiomarina tyrosinivorans]RUO80095.1 osmotically-inducible protein OsmY [Idiomarina tyrosinivorans]